MAPFGPLATMVSNAGRAAPSAIIRAASAAARWRSVTPGRMDANTSAMAWLLIRHAVASSSSSDGSLTVRRASIFRPNGTVVTPSAALASSAWRSTDISCASKATVRRPRRVISAASRGAMNRSTTSSVSAQSRWAASAYRESVASTAGPLASRSSAAFELAKPVR
jgi:hypothetical protein